MTDRRDFKKRVRQRQTATGENYTTAREQVLAGRTGSGVPVVELIDASEQARQLGLGCGVLVSTAVVERLEPERVLRGVRDALMASKGEPRADRMHMVALCGRPMGPERAPYGGSLAARH